MMDIDGEQCTKNYKINEKSLTQLTRKELKCEISKRRPERYLSSSKIHKADLVDELNDILDIDNNCFRLKKRLRVVIEVEPTADPPPPPPIIKNIEIIKSYKRVQTNGQQPNGQQKQQQQTTIYLNEYSYLTPIENEEERKEIEEEEEEIEEIETDEDKAMNLFFSINKSFNFFKITSKKESGGIKVQQEFIRFMIIKAMYKDNSLLNNEPSKLIASSVVQQYWEFMALDKYKYKEFLKLLGTKIHFDIQDKLDLLSPSNEKLRELRLKYEKTLELYKQYFPYQSNKNSCWPSDYLQKPYYLPDSPMSPSRGGRINLTITLFENRHIPISIEGNKSFKSVFQQFYQTQGLNQDCGIFIYNDEIVCKDDTPLKLGIKNRDTIEFQLDK